MDGYILCGPIPPISVYSYINLLNKHGLTTGYDIGIQLIPSDNGQFMLLVRGQAVTGKLMLNTPFQDEACPEEIEPFMLELLPDQWLMCGETGYYPCPDKFLKTNFCLQRQGKRVLMNQTSNLYDLDGKAEPKTLSSTEMFCCITNNALQPNAHKERNKSHLRVIK